MNGFTDISEFRMLQMHVEFKLHLFSPFFKFHIDSLSIAVDTLLAFDHPVLPP